MTCNFPIGHNLPGVRKAGPNWGVGTCLGLLSRDSDSAFVTLLYFRT
jgi:hypothetical protein